MVVQIQPIRVQRPNYDVSALTKALDDIGRQRREDEEKAKQLEISQAIGSKLSGNDLRGGAATAFERGELKTGMAIRQMEQGDEDRTFQRGRISAADQRAAAADARARQKDEEARAEKARGYIANQLTALDPKDPEFATKWQGVTGRLRRSGYKIEPEMDDPAVGYPAALAEVSDWKSRQDMAGRQQDQRLREQTIRIQQGEADSRIMSRARNDIIKALPALQAASSPEQWEAQQPIIQAAFGRSVPYNERGYILAQARGAVDDGDAFAPNPQERELGITREQKLERARQEKFKETYGEPKRGFVWSQDAKGNPVQKQVATPSKPVDPAMQNVLKEYTSRLDDAEKRILGSNFAQTYVGATDEKGGGGWGKAGRAYEDFESAALGIVYAMSGKQTTNAEMARFLRINKPQWNDSSETIKYRTARMKGALKAISSNLDKGMSYDEAEAAGLAAARGPEAPDASRRPSQTDRDRERGRAIRGMSDEDLLKALGR